MAFHNRQFYSITLNYTVHSEVRQCFTHSHHVTFIGARHILPTSPSFIQNSHYHRIMHVGVLAVFFNRFSLYHLTTKLMSSIISDCLAFSTKNASHACDSSDSVELSSFTAYLLGQCLFLLAH